MTDKQPGTETPWSRRRRRKPSASGNGTAQPSDDRLDTAAEAPEPLTDEPNRGRFKLTPFDAIRVGLTRSYLVKGIIPRDGVVVVWGPPKCGKTFWTFDLVMHIAAGWEEYRAQKVHPGSVVYVACEGERGLAARVEAFRRGKMVEGESGARFSLVSTRLDLVEDCGALIDAIRAQLPGGKCSALVIDTLNRSIRGSESDDAVMGAYVRAADALREAFGCAVIIIHHCGIDTTRPRGHTSLAGAADAQIAVRRDSAGRIATEVEWMKDGPEGAKTLSTLEVVEVGEDEDGEPITSCIVQPCGDEEMESTRKRPKVSGANKVALDMLRKAIEEMGEPAPASRTIPKDARVVRLDVWQKYAETGSVPMTTSKDPDSRRRIFARSASNLQAAGLVGVWSDWAWLKP